MDNQTKVDRTIGYCTNVHAGTSLAQTKANIENYAAKVKQIVSPDEPMGIGWWLSRQAVTELFTLGADGLPQLKDWFKQLGLIPFTCNGFPYGDFHQAKVKHNVYEPSWSTSERVGYTHALIAILTEISSNFSHRSISTLPIGWPGKPCANVDVDTAALNLLELAKSLREIADSTGVFIHIDLEPEPGCILQRSTDVVEFFENYLLPNARQLKIPADTVLGHIRVCHDICHAAVMFEDQQTVINRYKKAGIRIGKVQVSSAIKVLLDNLMPIEKEQALQQLSAFAEDRYLHQTMIRLPNGDLKFFEDLPIALDSEFAQQLTGEWRVHFHVPIFLDRFEFIRTTQKQIIECLDTVKNDDDIYHYEVETYAWNVLPEDLQTEDLAQGIAQEINWLKDQMPDEQS